MFLNIFLKLTPDLIIDSTLSKYIQHAVHQSADVVNLQYLLRGLHVVLRQRVRAHPEGRDRQLDRRSDYDQVGVWVAQ